MKTLSFNISDELYELLQQRADLEHKKVEDIALAWLSEYAPKSRSTLLEAESQAAWDRLLSHAGAASLGRPTGANNEQIDIDLARDYDNPHKDT